MKLHKKLFFGVVMATITAIGAGSCTDELAVGNSFLDKAAGASVTQDTVLIIQNIHVSSWLQFIHCNIMDYHIKVVLVHH
jgi:hypothetical protein